MKRILTAILLLSCISPAFSADLRTLFVNMPDTILPTLTRNDRLDFLDYMDSGMKARARNRLGGESVMTSFSDNMLTVMTSGSGRTDIVLFERRKGQALICVITTVTARYSDSRLSFFNEDWTPVSTESLIDIPVFKDYLTPQALKSDSLDVLEKQSLLRLAEITPTTEALEFTYTSVDAIGPDAALFRDFFIPGPVRYTWNGKRFVKGK